MRFFGFNIIFALLILFLSIYSRRVLGIEGSSLLAQFINFGGAIALVSTGRLEYLKKSNSFYGNLASIGLLNLIIISTILSLFTKLDPLLLISISFVLCYSSIITEYFLRTKSFNSVLLSKYSSKTILYSTIAICKSLSFGIYSSALSFILLLTNPLKIKYSIKFKKSYFLAWLNIYRKKSIFIILASTSTWLPILLLTQDGRTKDIAILGLLITLCGTPSNLLGSTLRESFAALNFHKINKKLNRLFQVFGAISLLGFLLLVPSIRDWVEYLIKITLSEEWIELSILLPYAFFFYSLNVIIHTLTFLNFRYLSGTLENNYVLLTIFISLGFISPHFSIDFFYFLRGLIAIFYIFVYYKKYLNDKFSIP